MKYIFLDIDGVLNRDATEIAAPSGCMFVEEELVKKLQHIYYETHAKIVLSSSWRMGWYDIASGKTDTHNAADYSALAAKLMSFGIPIDGHTELLYDQSRAGEIRKYLNGEKDVDGFVILDDMRIKGYEEHQVMTDPGSGLADADAERAIRLLKKYS